MKTVRAIQHFTPTDEKHLQIQKDQACVLIDDSDFDWWLVQDTEGCATSILFFIVMLVLIFFSHYFLSFYVTGTKGLCRVHMWQENTKETLKDFSKNHLFIL